VSADRSAGRAALSNMTVDSGVHEGAATPRCSTDDLSCFSAVSATEPDFTSLVQSRANSLNFVSIFPATSLGRAPLLLNFSNSVTRLIPNVTERDYCVFRSAEKFDEKFRIFCPPRTQQRTQPPYHLVDSDIFTRKGYRNGARATVTARTIRREGVRGRRGDEKNCHGERFRILAA